MLDHLKWNAQAAILPLTPRFNSKTTLHLDSAYLLGIEPGLVWTRESMAVVRETAALDSQETDRR